MLLPKFTLKYISVGSGSIIGRDNIEEFFNHVSKVNDFEDRSLVELAPNYEIATASLVHMLEARFVNLNSIMQHMFLTLRDMEEGEKKDFF
jgi:predicted transcriptional regulator